MSRGFGRRKGTGWARSGTGSRRLFGGRQGKVHFAKAHSVGFINHVYDVGSGGWLPPGAEDPGAVGVPRERPLVLRTGPGLGPVPRPYGSGQSSARRIDAAPAMARIFPSALARGRYFIPQSVAMVIRSGEV
jgi:hypothetical protein